MKQSQLTLEPSWFIGYKFMNSLFLGLSVGSIFTIYAPLEPSIYSMGGIVLAFLMLLVARFYDKILNALWFFRITFFVELVLLIAIIYFLLYPYEYHTALIFYIGYQITFIFGSYLVRVETLLLEKDILLTKVDSAKQLGYLLGMLLSYLFYKLMVVLHIVQNDAKVYNLHFVLGAMEIVIIVLVLKSFSREPLVNPHK